MTYELVFDSDVPPEAPDQRSFEAAFAQAAGVCHATIGALLDLMIQALNEDRWQGFRIHSPVQWLMWQAGMCRSTARRLTTLAARASDLPVTLGLLREGRLSLDQAHAIARYTPTEFEESVCSFAQSATVSQIVSATRRYGFDIEGRSKPGRGRKRSVDFGFDDDGDWWARIRLAAEEGAVVEAALAKVRDEMHNQAREAAKTAAAEAGRSADGSDADLGVSAPSYPDAFLGLANSVLDHGVSDSTARARRTLHIHLEAPETAAPAGSDASAGHGSAAPGESGAPAGSGFATPGIHDSGMPGPTDHGSKGDVGNRHIAKWAAEFHGGTRIPDWLARKLSCDCDISLIWQRHGIPLSTSAGFRNPPDRLRRLVERRDGYQCRVPGCTNRHWLEVHHIVHWEDGGLTVTWNLVLLCGKHHRMHHRGLLNIEGNADIEDGPASKDLGGLRFTNEHGLDVRDTLSWPGSRRCDWPTVQPYRHPTGERLNYGAVHFNSNTQTRTGAATADTGVAGHTKADTARPTPATGDAAAPNAAAPDPAAPDPAAPDPAGATTDVGSVPDRDGAPPEVRAADVARGRAASSFAGSQTRREPAASGWPPN